MENYIKRIGGGYIKKTTEIVEEGREDYRL